MQCWSPWHLLDGAPQIRRLLCCDTMPESLMNFKSMTLSSKMRDSYSTGGYWLTPWNTMWTRFNLWLLSPFSESWISQGTLARVTQYQAWASPIRPACEMVALTKIPSSSRNLQLLQTSQRVKVTAWVRIENFNKSNHWFTLNNWNTFHNFHSNTDHRDM